MTRADVAELMQKRQDALDRRDVEVLSKLHAEDCVVESPLGGGVTRGREAIEKVYETVFKAWEGVTFLEEELLIDGARAVTIQRMSGADSGGLLGGAATGRPFSVPIVSFVEFRDDLIVRERRIYDFTGLLAQLGTIKVKPA